MQFKDERRMRKIDKEKKKEIEKAILLSNNGQIDNKHVEAG